MWPVFQESIWITVEYLVNIRLDIISNRVKIGLVYN